MKTWTLFLVILFSAAACGKGGDSGKSGNKSAGVEPDEADEEPVDPNKKPWDCSEVAARLGWSPDQQGFVDRVDWCENDSVREDPDVFANIVSKNGRAVKCAEVMARLGQPKGTQRYDDLVYGCVKQGSDPMVKCALDAPDNAKLIECGWQEYKQRYINVLTGESKLKAKYQKLADEMKADEEAAAAKAGGKGKKGK
jgi:hypothetical protein